jgi:SagB-type dehydrogenase family enzyme
MATSSLIYHRSTSYDRRHMQPHALDWRDQPLPYKRYAGIESLPLPRTSTLSAEALSRIAGFEGIPSSPRSLDLEALAEILYPANGLTGKTRQAGTTFFFRSAPSAGALYPNEIYLVWPATPGQVNPAPGVFNYDVHNHSLVRLRQGHFLPAACAWVEGGAPNPVALFLITGLFFRSAWKYRQRAYRYVLMDAGHVMESLRLAIQAAGFSCRLTQRFDDLAVNRLLGLDPQREVGIGCVYVYGDGPKSITPDLAPGTPVESVESLPESVLAACRCADKEIGYEEIFDIHAAGTGYARPEAQGPAAPMMDCLGVSRDTFRQIPSALGDSGADALSGAGAKPPLTYAETVFRRRSRRNFVPQATSKEQLMYILDLLCKTADQNLEGGHGHSGSIAVGLLAGNVDGTAPGFYLLDTRQRRLNRVFEGHVINEMSAACLDQAWLAYAGVHFLFMANLDVIDRQWGARGYRYAMTTAGRLGHAVYLAATALGLGACGIGAIYDGEARRLLGLNADSALLYLVAAGVVKR